MSEQEPPWSPAARDPGTRLQIAGTEIPPGRTTRLEVPVGRLSSGTPLALPLKVVRGRKPGVHLWLSAAVHGDELNGIEIIRRVLDRVDARSLAGAILAVPIVNPFGFVHESRYTPDRRDLNRSFPGSARGSMASRLAHTFMKEVVQHCDVGIDLHTGSDHRRNLPQVRTNLDNPATLGLARAFGPPVIVNAEIRDGSLRAAGFASGRPVLVFEGGEPHRFNPSSIQVGERGVLRVLAHLGMIDPLRLSPSVTDPAEPPRECRRTRWIRAGQAGILRLTARPGDTVAKGERLGFIADPFGAHPRYLKAPVAGIVLGVTRNPLVNRGDAVANLGS